MIAPLPLVSAEAVQQVLARFDQIRTPAVMDAPPVIAVVGAFSRGKSALINALIDLPLLPVHALPATALPTRLHYAPTLAASLRFADHDQPLSLDALPDLSRDHDPTGWAAALEIDIGCPSDLLAGGIVLLDTPGIDTAQAAPLVIADDVAALIAVVAADPPLSAAEALLFADVCPRVPLTVWVQTRADTLSPADLETATRFNQDAIRQVTVGADTLHSRLFSLSSRTGDGLADFRAELQRFSSDDLQLMRRVSHLTQARTDAQPLLLRLSDDRRALDAIRTQISAAQTTFELDLDEIQAATLATLAHLSEYVLGNLSMLIYRTEPLALSGSAGLALADGALSACRDELRHALTGALLASRRTLLTTLDSVLAVDDFPSPPAVLLPDPARQTITVRIGSRQRFGLAQIDVDQTVNAYRQAVSHRADLYAAVLAPLCDHAFEQWQAQSAGWFTDQRQTIAAQLAMTEALFSALRVWF